jgi:hypothetical protein
MGFAFYSELPDELKTTTAFYGAPSMWQAMANLFTDARAYPRFDRLQRFLHSLDGGLAGPRRACLRKLLQDPSLEPWQRGFINHAFGDSYAHSYIDDRPYITGGSFRHPFRWKNPNYNIERLYVAPIGHGHKGNAPDQVWRRPELFEAYMSDLVATLNRGPLNQDQNGLLQLVLDEAYTLPKGSSGKDEAIRFRALAVNAFGYPSDGYDPDKYDALSRAAFAQGPGRSVPFELPTDDDVDRLIEKIKKTCCAIKN